MAYLNDWGVNGIYRIFTGKISGDEIIQAVLEIEGDQRFDELDYIINDFRQVDDYIISERDITTIVKIDNNAVKMNPQIRVAIVVTLDSLQEWAKLYCQKMHNSPYECKVFSHMEEAEEWAVLSNNQTGRI